MISLEQVRHIAKLARILAPEQQLIKFQEEFTSILGYFEILSELDVAKTEPMTHAVPIANSTRPDTAKPRSAEEAQKLLEAAPATQQGYVKVKSIL